MLQVAKIDTDHLEVITVKRGLGKSSKLEKVSQGVGPILISGPSSIAKDILSDIMKINPEGEA